MQPILTAGQLGAVRLVVVDYPNDIEDRAEAGADGVAYVLLDPIPAGMLWRIERMTTFVTDQAGNLVVPPNGALFGFYKANGGQLAPVPANFRDGSQSPGFDVADEASPIVVQSGLSPLFYWSGLTPGTFGNVTAQYQLVAKLTGVT